MTFTSLKTIAVFGALALITAFTSGAAQAQTTIQASITTDAAITVVDGDDMDFGTWFLAVNAGDDFLLTMDNAGVITPSGVATSFATEITAVNQAATLTVDVPAGVTNAVLQMTRGAIIDFPDAGLTFQNPTYTTATEAGDNIIPLTAVPVTVAAGGTPETVTFGGEINVTATPADATHVASFIVSFAY